MRYKTHEISLFLLVLSVVAACSSALSRTDVFDASTNDQWAEDLCSDNTTCLGNGKRCFSQLRRARWFVQSLREDSSSPDSLAERCRSEKESFDLCATEANLNVTWSSITGSDLPCEASFLRGRPPFPRGPPRPFFRRRRRRTHPHFRPFFPIHTPVHHGWLSSPSRRIARDLARRGPGAGGWRRPLRGPRGSIGRVETFLNTLEKTNAAAFQNFTDCTLTREGLLTDAGVVNRTAIQIFATVAFAAEPRVLTEVKEAMETCAEPTRPQLEDYMKCWATACIDAKMA